MNAINRQYNVGVLLFLFAIAFAKCGATSVPNTDNKSDNPSIQDDLKVLFGENAKKEEDYNLGNILGLFKEKKEKHQEAYKRAKKYYLNKLNKDLKVLFGDNAKKEGDYNLEDILRLSKEIQEKHQEAYKRTKEYYINKFSKDLKVLFKEMEIMPKEGDYNLEDVLGLSKEIQEKHQEVYKRAKEHYLNKDLKVFFGDNAKKENDYRLKNILEIAKEIQEKNKDAYERLLKYYSRKLLKLSTDAPYEEIGLDDLAKKNSKQEPYWWWFFGDIYQEEKDHINKWQKMVLEKEIGDAEKANSLDGRCDILAKEKQYAEKEISDLVKKHVKVLLEQHSQFLKEDLLRLKEGGDQKMVKSYLEQLKQYITAAWEQGHDIYPYLEIMSYLTMDSYAIINSLIEKLKMDETDIQETLSNLTIDSDTKLEDLVNKLNERQLIALTKVKRAKAIAKAKAKAKQDGQDKDSTTFPNKDTKEKLQLVEASLATYQDFKADLKAQNLLFIILTVMGYEETKAIRKKLFDNLYAAVKEGKDATDELLYMFLGVAKGKKEVAQVVSVMEAFIKQDETTSSWKAVLNKRADHKKQGATTGKKQGAKTGKKENSSNTLLIVLLGIAAIIVLIVLGYYFIYRKEEEAKSTK